MRPANYSRDMRRALKRANAKQPTTLAMVDPQEWPRQPNPKLTEVWRSRDFLVQVFAERGGLVRLSVCRAEVDATSGRWSDGISWDDLQRLKRECGRGHLDAVEVYPQDKDVVNVANMRHLWVFDQPLDFAWRKE